MGPATEVNNDTTAKLGDASNRLELVGQLAAGIAHEINTPVQYVGDNVRYICSEMDNILNVLGKYRDITRLIENSETLRTQLSEVQCSQDDLEFLIAEIPAALEETLRGVESIAGIVRSMKSLVHPGGKNKVPIDVNVAINHAVTLSRGEWKNCAEIDLQLGNPLPQVMCYPGELNQVLLNLVVNAAHAVADSEGDDTGRIALRSFVYKNSVGITVEDSGSGIPLEIQHRIFDPFFTSKDEGKGTGQGLAFAHASIVERSGGTLFFETIQGSGTTFHIYLPCANSQP